MISIESKALHRYRYSVKESVCTIITDIEKGIETAVDSINLHRSLLENYVEINPEFKASLIPVQIGETHEIIHRMAKAANIAGVGPMAAVAGALCDLAVEEMVKIGVKVAVVENGGEAFIVSDQPIDLAIQAGDTPLSRKIGFRLEKFPIGVATSSGKFSHALSFGDSDAVTVFAVNASLADAVATRVGNVIKSEETIDSGVNLALSIPGVFGALIIYNKKVGFGGDLPQFIQIESDKTEDLLV